jgi:hypothetical protein
MAQGLPLAEELSAVFARMSGLLLSEETVSTAVSLITSLARDCIPGTVGAGVTLIDEWGGKQAVLARSAGGEGADQRL